MPGTTPDGAALQEWLETVAPIRRCQRERSLHLKGQTCAAEARYALFESRPFGAEDHVRTELCAVCFSVWLGTAGDGWWEAL